MRDAILIDIGVILADVFYLFIAYFSAEKIVEILQNYSWVQYIGGAILIGYGLFTIIKKKSPQKGTNMDIRKLKRPSAIGLISKGMALNAVNIGVLVYWIMVCTVEIKGQQIEGIYVVIFFVVTLGTMFGIDVLKIYFASKLKQRLTSKALNNISIVVGCILVLIGIGICFTDLNLPPEDPSFPLKGVLND